VCTLGSFGSSWASKSLDFHWQSITRKSLRSDLWSPSSSARLFEKKEEITKSFGHLRQVRHGILAPSTDQTHAPSCLFLRYIHYLSCTWRWLGHQRFQWFRSQFSAATATPYSDRQLCKDRDSYLFRLNPLLCCPGRPATAYQILKRERSDPQGSTRGDYWRAILLFVFLLWSVCLNSLKLM
jgi:hypothetical protein